MVITIHCPRQSVLKPPVDVHQIFGKRLPQEFKRMSKKSGIIVRFPLKMSEETYRTTLDCTIFALAGTSLKKSSKMMKEKIAKALCKIFRVWLDEHLEYIKHLRDLQPDEEVSAICNVNIFYQMLVNYDINDFYELEQEHGIKVEFYDVGDEDYASE